MKMQYVQGKPIFTSINKNIKQFKYLDKDLETEVCVIGGGVTGAIVGYYMSKNNISSVVLDKSRFAHLSTSVTTSLLQYELDDNLSDLTEYTTLSNAIKSYKLGLKALSELEDFIKINGNHCLYKKKDTLLYTAKNNEINAIKNEYDLRKENELDVEYIDDTNSPFSFDLKAGIISKNGGSELDPVLFTHQLLNVAQNNGLKAFENTEVIDIKYNNELIEVITEFGYTVKCKKVVVATGYNTLQFTKRNFATKSTTFNIATKPVENFDGWDRRILIRDNCDPYNYLRTTDDNRLIIGGEDISFIPGIFDEKAANEKYDILEARLKSMFPNINNIEVDYKYCGTFASTSDNLGFIGPDPDHNNLWYCLGYGANGILFAILGGMFLSDLYKNKVNKDMNLFKVNRFDK
ncbi:FAD-dependent oxidoreductase [Clostridium sp. CCUG 7971]|uniref:NAD(P)/FAD-dependent oxidoreductase n=1 Tax=Clostridium sp. CCUG 7971 TaxID=2811414 RepID=UPI001ABA924B|nr:FAD-dependent oxidoreductase [Clostridium sp. CCUG 7971]MBO3444028.1 FAD-binding oxidoreductase [Clostridium sp. CCUG 7971]